MQPKIYTTLAGVLAFFSLLQTHAQTNKSLSNLTAPTAINQSMLPNGDSSKDLGNTAKAWRSLYLSHRIYLQDSLVPHAAGSNNIFLGSSAGNIFTTSAYNAAFGSNALRSLTSGWGNVAGGYNALAKNTSGSVNNASGYYALYSNTTGQQNVATGFNSLYRNVTGSYNTAEGSWALYYNTTGHQNTAVGSSALMFNVTGSANTANGVGALSSNDKGHSNVAVGARALYKSSKNSNLVAIGDSALYNFTGSSWDLYGYNTAVGSKALYSATTGSSNTAVGIRALYNTTTGGVNTAIGEAALFFNTEGNFNTGIGRSVLSYNTTGTYNTAIGFSTLGINRTGSQNTAIGAYAGPNFYDGVNNSTSIGYLARATTSNQVRIGNTAVTSIGGQVGWTIFSDGRYKTDIKEDVSGLAFINSLRPITYKVEAARLNAFLNKNTNETTNGIAKRDNDQSTAITKALEKASAIVHTGFVAQEVEEAANKVGYVFDGVDKPESEGGLYGLRYDGFVAPLVKAVQELSKLNTQKDSIIERHEERIQRLEKRIGTGGVTPHGATLAAASLGQNSPNPFHNTTTIQYTLPEAYSTAQILITDKEGRTVKQIRVSGNGSGTAYIAASLLSSGTYHYSLLVDGKRIDTKQMVVTK